MKKTVLRPDPDTLSSNLGIRPADVRAAVRERHNVGMNEEWIIVYVNENSDLFAVRCASEALVRTWLLEHQEKAVVLGPVAPGLKIQDRT